MSAKGLVRRVLGSIVQPYGYEIVDRNALYDWQQPNAAVPAFAAAQLPPGADAYLRDDNPALQDLKRRYASFNKDATTPLVWTEDFVSGDALRWFRGNHAYLWQLRGPNMNAMGYALSAYYARAIDTLHLLDRLTDDNLFGNVTFQVDGRPVSRDLLDSVIEIYFLERHLGLSRMTRPVILDIGAGYGRLAHRIVEGLPDVERYLCVDAVAASTFVSEYYLNLRGTAGRAEVLPLDAVERALAVRQIDLAINVHSFSECRLEAIDWWLGMLARHGVRQLMIVPNAKSGDGGQSLLTNDGNDFRPVVEKHGYTLVAREPKYRDPIVQQFGINPTFHFLFRREG